MPRAPKDTAMMSATDLALALMGPVGATVGPGVASKYGSKLMTHAIADDAGKQIGQIEAFTGPSRLGQAINVMRMDLGDKARGSVSQMRDIVRGLLEHYPDARKVFYGRTSGAKAKAAASRGSMGGRFQGHEVTERMRQSGIKK